jgi:hypothetical protein
MVKNKDEPKRRNRFVGLDEAANAVLDPVFRKRGFANRDLFARWREIAPPPYDKTTLPERLFWPRRETGSEGAILILRCAPGMALAVSHESERIARAVNTYFGYFLVRELKLSAEPFVPAAPDAAAAPECPPEIRAEIGRMVETVEDEGLRTALRHLGENLKAAKS